MLAAEELARGLRAAPDGVPLLAFRLPVLERTAWRAGLRAARALERKARSAFADATGRVLRAADLTAHDRGSDVFLAALAATPRDGAATPAPVDVRSAQARIASLLGGVGDLDVDAGWTRFGPGDAIEAAVERAIARGAAERERYAFFSAVGHELRTPLSAIRGYLETLAGEQIAPDLRRRFTATAHAEAVRLGRLVDAMFELSLLDLAATFPARAGGALDVACDAALLACAAEAAARGVALVRRAIPPVTLAIDGDRLTLVLINLLDNAVKHGRFGGRVVLGVALEHPRAIVLTVDDDGPGIAAADRERVFAFGARGATAVRGSGIGLAFVRMTMDRVGGRVELGESPAGGARFTLTIPRR